MGSLDVVTPRGACTHNAARFSVQSGARRSHRLVAGRGTAGWAQPLSVLPPGFHFSLGGIMFHFLRKCCCVPGWPQHPAVPCSTGGSGAVCLLTLGTVSFGGLVWPFQCVCSGLSCSESLAEPVPGAAPGFAVWAWQWAGSSHTVDTAHSRCWHTVGPSTE